MGVSIPSNANHVMLKWARGKLTIEFVAEKLGVESKLIEKWETGDGTPSLPKLEEIAKIYGRATPIFYLPAPPTEFNVAKLKDYRTRTGAAPQELSAELHYAIRRTRELQEWAVLALEDEYAAPSDIVGSIELPSDPGKVARHVRKLLNVSLQIQTESRLTSSGAFDLWRERCEALGIYVFQVDGVEVSEMQGFAIADKLAPVIAVNIADFPTAKTFTLLHELGHILLGISAIVGFDAFIETNQGPQSERFCNRLAAEILVPESDFRNNVPKDWQKRDNKVLRDLADRYKTSRLMIALRLVETGFAEWPYFFKKRKMLQTERRKNGNGPRRTFVEKKLARFGKPFCQLAASEFQSGQIHGGQLTTLLGMSLKHLPELESRLFPHRVMN
jgi:Zn-dependent peptidase ImmA (M78 family)/transcriptional regulator with XRE-family HTH domain